MDPEHVTLPLAFLAGLLSFLSPCVLPLVPAYMGYLGGTALITREGSATWRGAFRTFSHALAFVLGFSIVFVLLGASATFAGRLLRDYSEVLRRVGGVMLAVFGMRLMGGGWKRWAWIVGALATAAVALLLDSGLLVQGRVELGPDTWIWLADAAVVGLAVLAGANWNAVGRLILALGAGVLHFYTWLELAEFVPNFLASLLVALVVFFLNRAEFFYADRRLEPSSTEKNGYLRSALFGVVFAAGWTPCIGPILAAIFLVASQLDTVGQGTLLLAAYSLGLGVPFLLVGLLFGPVSKGLSRMRRYLGVVSLISGVLLVLMGILLFTDSLTFLAQYGEFFKIEL